MRIRKRRARQEALGMLTSDITVSNSSVRGSLAVKVTPKSQTGEAGGRVSLDEVEQDSEVSSACVL